MLSKLHLAVTALVVACTAVRSGAQITVEAGSSVTLYFTPDYDPQTGEFDYIFDRAETTISITPHVPLVIPVSFTGARSTAWSNPLNWGGYLLAVDAAQLALIVRNGPSIGAVTEAYDTLKNGGPTEKSVTSNIKTFTSQYLPGGKLSVGASLDCKFDVTLPSGAVVNMDQSPVVLENLLVIGGASLAGNGNFVTRKDLINHGTLTQLGGTVERDFINDSTTGLGAEITGNFSIQGAFTNTSNIRVLSGGTLSRAAATTNLGTITINNGQLHMPNGLIDRGRLDGFGVLKIDIEEYGTLSANVGGNTMEVGAFDVHPTINNHNRIEAVNGGTLRLTNATTINQDAGASVVADGGVVHSAQATISHGSLEAANGGYFEVSSYLVLDAVRNNAPIRVLRNFNTSLDIRGGSLENNNIITVGYSATGGATPSISFAPDTNLTGTGEIVLSNARMDGNTVTQGAGQVIRGWGVIQNSINVYGKISADTIGQTLDTGAFNYRPTINNHNRIEAVNGGTLRLTNATTINQDANASVVADSGVVHSAQATISHGSLEAANGGYFEVSSFLVLDAVKNNAPIRVLRNFNTSLDIRGGSFENNNTVTVGYPAAGGATPSISFAPDTNLTGTGEIVLNNARMDGSTVTQGAGHVIRGWGVIQNSLNLFGKISADVSGQTLDTGAFNYRPTINNHNRIEAINGGTLRLTNATTINQDAGASVVADGGIVHSAQATISHGSLEAANGGYFEVSSFLVLDAVKNNAPIRVLRNFNTSLDIRGGVFENNNTISVGYPAAGGATPSISFAPDTNLTGAGEIVLNNARMEGTTVTQGSGHALIGVGTVSSPLVSAGVIAPGLNIGKLTMAAPVTLLDDSHIKFEIGGTVQGSEYDWLSVTSSILINGDLDLSFANGFEDYMSGNDIFTILTSNSLSGSFDNVENGGRLFTEDSQGSFIVNYGPASPFGSDRVVLSQGQVHVVPEPHTGLFGVIGACFFAMRRRLSKRAR